MTEPRRVIWTPSKERAKASTLAHYQAWLKDQYDLSFADFPAMWEWSVDEIEAFWATIWEYFDVRASKHYDCVLKERIMPGAKWFPGARLNYAEQILRHAETNPSDTALVSISETFPRCEMTWNELSDRVAGVAASLKDLGVSKGDRVTAILPNTPEAIIAFLATASVGAIWSLCAPDMGHVAVIDRFAQIEPKILIVQDGYFHAGKTVDRRDVIEMVSNNLPTVEHRFMIPVVGEVSEGWAHWDALNSDTTEIQIEQVAFDDPLWVVYSSGTTGNPKPIVHGHGGPLLEGAKQSLHQDFKPGDRFSWLTSSGWVMWNAQLAALGQRMTVVLFDGAPNFPDWSVVWNMIAQEQLDYFGAGAAFFASSMKAGLKPGEQFNLSKLRSLGSTGSPLSDDAYSWIYSDVKPDVWLAPISGGTDLLGAFVCGNPMEPVRIGEMQSRALGNAVRAFDESGQEVFNQVGELVCTEPLPSMPLFFWGDEDGSRFHESYFDMYPGIWRHGDWIEISPTGSSVIYGRSDATINRMGLRMGSAEIYQAVEALDVVMDSLVVDLEYLGRESFMPLFVVLRDGAQLSDEVKKQINDSIRTGVSARFLPNEIRQISDVPRTLSGKKLEVPVKKLLLGGDPEKIVNRDSMANPDSFDQFIEYAKEKKLI